MSDAARIAELTQAIEGLERERGSFFGLPTPWMPDLPSGRVYYRKRRLFESRADYDEYRREEEAETRRMLESARAERERVIEKCIADDERRREEWEQSVAPYTAKIAELRAELEELLG